MTAFAGFYASPELWLNWMLSSPHCPDWQWGDGTAELIINRVLREKELGKHFYAELVPVPPSERYKGDRYGMMLVRRRKSKRAYIAQKPDSKYDLNGQKILKKQIGLEVSGWKTMWYNEESPWSPYEAQFLEPGDSAEKSKASRKAGNWTKNKVKAKAKVTAETKGVVGSQGGGEGSTMGKVRMDLRRSQGTMASRRASAVRMMRINLEFVDIACYVA